MTGPRDVLDELYGAYEDRLMSDDAHETYLTYAADALPVLVAAVRGVLDVRDELAEDARTAKRLADEAPDDELRRISLRHARVAHHAASALDAALTHLAGDHTTPETRADAVDEIERRERQAAAKALNEAAAWVWDQPKPWAEVWHELRDRAIALDPELP